ncbi:MAG: hypothetical protein AABX16_03460 [Nanoarchaeota archaeon]
MNRAGVGWLTEDTGKIVLAVICVVILLGFAAKLFFFVKADSEAATMKTQLETLTLAIQQSSTEGQEKIIELFPKTGWYLRSFPDNDFPQGNCRGGIGCICFCKNVECTDKRECSSFSFDVFVEEEIFSGYSLDERVTYGEQENKAIVAERIESVLELQSIEVLRIFPQGDFIVIKRAEQKK